MDNSSNIKLMIEEACDPAEILATLGDGMTTLTSFIGGENKKETESLKFMMNLMAKGVTEVAVRMKNRARL
ncbi:hypothetical protein [Maridesulfovibrio ferrireducens]|uniref:hypothetical protein n=1 Tax=Maridesulfovibrio ferrireducens TaxID=246191 RepID=UPI001A184413|nr:hypothetical protein [Maridesulfovibrio ferrireducens]MBI9112235.1 hypothetical protein [Maridesulfovibrio ferrireducens]